MVDKSTLQLVWQESIETFRTQMRLTTQIITFLIIADVTIVGYSVSEKSLSLMLIGVVFPINIILFMSYIRKLIIPVIYTVLILEKELNLSPKFRLAGNFARYINKLDDEKYEEILNSADINDLNNAEKLIGKSLSSMMSSVAAIITYSSLIGQLIVPLLLYYFADWKLF